MIHLHHVHLFSQDLDATVAWYRRAFDAEVYYDGDFGGSRNVFMKIGSGRIHLYSQPPRDNGKGAIHHIGIRTNDLASLRDRLLQMGVRFRSGIREFGTWRYLMCPAPDQILIELFEIETASILQNSRATSTTSLATRTSARRCFSFPTRYAGEPGNTQVIA